MEQLRKGNQTLDGYWYNVGGAREMMKGSKKEREGGGKVRRNKQKHSVNPQEKALTSFCVAIVADPAG